MYDYCVYVLQIDDDPKYIYVGQTYLTPEERLIQHIVGIHSARCLRHANKLSLRPDIYAQLPRVKTRQEALDLESNVAVNLSKIGYKVLGGH